MSGSLYVPSLFYALAIIASWLQSLGPCHAFLLLSADYISLAPLLLFLFRTVSLTVSEGYHFNVYTESL
jgi:hypothetical protein